MVWFYRFRTACTTSNLTRFQSHYGLILSQRVSFRFVEKGSGLSIPLWSDFILLVASADAGYDFNFQSHYGLILSFLSRWKNEWEYKYFQSHYGLILSAMCFTVWAIRITFNPTMVWFYQIIHALAEMSVYHFQSHYGLILSYTVKSRILPIPFFYFQSHYGLILSNTDTRQKWKHFVPFNPTMVWFYHTVRSRST